MSDGLPGFVAIPGGAEAPGASDDGRNIDLQIATLSGEGATQTPLASRGDVALQSQAFPHVPSRQPGQTPAYYETPVLKQPVWIWTVGGYFYLGGMAGACATLGGAVQLLGGPEMRGLVAKTRWVATAGALASTALLIDDLGRPERFLNMLRVFKITSPMSIGSWILGAFSTFASGAAILPYGPRAFRPLSGICGALAGLFGLPLAAYTGVLIVQTAVPVWRNPLWSVLSLCSGTAAAGSLLQLLPLNARESRAVEIFALAGKAGELIAANTIEQDAARVERVARPLRSGFTGFLWQSAKVLIAASALVSLAPGHSRKRRIAAGILGTAGSICVRFAYFLAGKRSARDPRATFEQQRQIPAAVAGEV